MESYLKINLASPFFNTPIIKNREFTELISSCIFYLSFILYALCSITLNENTFLPNTKKICSFALILTLLISIVNTVLFQNYSKFFLVLYLLVVACALMSTCHTMDFRFSVGLAVIFSSKNISLKHWEERYFHLFIFLMLGQITLYSYARNHAYILTPDDLQRWDLGISPSYLATVLVIFTLFIEYMNRKHFQIKDFLIVSFIMLLCWVGPNDKAASIFIVLSLILLFVLKFFSHKTNCNPQLNRIFSLQFPFFFVFTLLFQLLKNTKKITMWGTTFIAKSPTKIIKSPKIELSSIGRALVKNSYMKFLSENGFVPFLIVMLLLTCSIIWCLLNNQFSLLILISAIGFFAFIHPFAIYMGLLPCFVVLCQYDEAFKQKYHDLFEDISL